MNDRVKPLIRPWVLIAALMYVETIAAFETSMIYGAIGTLYKLFGDPVLVGWIIAVYLLVSACLTPLIARLGDLYGRQRLMLWMLFVVMTGSLISAVSPNIEGLLIGRGLQGVAGSFLPLCFGILREHIADSRQRLGTGLIAATASIASGLGVLAGGLIVDHMPWHTMFWLAALATLIAIGVTIVAIPRSRPARGDRKVDLLGGVLMVPMIAGCLFAIGQIKHWGIADLRIWTLLGGALLIGLYWFRHEWRRSQPLIDVRLLANRQVMLANAVMVISAYGVFQVGPFITMLLQQTPLSGRGFGISPTLSGAIMFGGQLMAMIGGPLAGRIADRQGARRALQIGALISAIGWVGMACAQNLLWLLIAMLCVQSIGSVMILAATPMVLADAVPLERTSEANGITAVLRQANLAIATQISAFLLSLHSVSVGGSQYPAPASIELTFVVLAGATILGFLVSLTLPRRGPPPLAALAV
jgi:MFS family permease